jgi:DNA-binding CsgD family transcriptional regulator
MLHVRAAESVSASELAVPGDRVAPTCSTHPGSLVRPYRTLGPSGPGVYPQCVPGGGEQPHLLAWTRSSGAPPAVIHELVALTPSELDVLRDASRGLTVVESAESRFKSPETVKSQRRQVLLKLGARNMTHAVALAAAERLIDLERAA